MKSSDVVFPALARNDQTKSIISKKLIRSMRESSIFVSIVDLSLYNHKLILDLAARNKLYGYAFEDEGGQRFNKYQGNVWAGPCLAWVTKDSARRNAESWVENIAQAARGNFPNRVN